MLEVLFVVMVTGIVAAIAVVGVSKSFQRSALASAARDVKSLVQRAQVEMKTSGQLAFIYITRITPPPHGATVYPKYWRVALWLDANGSGTPDVTGPTPADTLVAQLDLPSAISLSTTDVTHIESANWSYNGDDGNDRYLICDLLGRTFVPGPPPTQNTATATLEFTHQNMLPLASPTLTPSMKYELRMNPVWAADIQQYRWEGTWRKM